MKEAIECEINDFPQDVLEAELNRLRRQLEHELYQPFTRLRIRSALDNAFSDQVGWMHTAHVLLCIFLILAGLLGFLGLDTLAYCAVGGVLVVWILGAVQHGAVLRRLAADMEREARTLDSVVRDEMPKLVRELVVSRVGAYRSLYAVASQRVSEYVERLQPLQERHNAILRELRTTAPRI